MPTYLYECENCGRFEEFQKITDPALEECPECGGKTKRLIGKPSIIFKGSGFYSTDNKTDSTRNNEPVNNNGKTANEEVKTSSKTETKKNEAKKDSGGEKVSN